MRRSRFDLVDRSSDALLSVHEGNREAPSSILFLHLVTVMFQWFMCAGIFFIGTIFFFIQCGQGHDALGEGPSCPIFIPFASIGGVIWCTSNLLLVPIVDTIGLGMAMCVWGLSEMLTVRRGRWVKDSGLLVARVSHVAT